MNAETSSFQKIIENKLIDEFTTTNSQYLPLAQKPPRKLEENLNC